MCPGLPYSGTAVRSLMTCDDEATTGRRTSVALPLNLSRRSARLTAMPPQDIAVSVLDSGSWQALTYLFGRSGASNGCWCQYWLLGRDYHRRDRTLNRQALHDEVDRIPAHRAELAACPLRRTAAGRRRRVGDAVLLRAHALAGPGRDVGAHRCGSRPRRSAWPGHAGGLSGRSRRQWRHQEPVPGRAATVPAAGFAEVSRLSKERPVVRYRP